MPPVLRNSATVPAGAATDAALVPPPHLASDCGAEECRIAVDGVDIRFLRAGSGPPLLLIHGLMGYSFSWRHNIAALSKVATVYAPDLPGAGYSARTAMDCSFTGFARLLVAFMDALGLAGATVVGTSHGGAIAMRMASIDLESSVRRISRLVLVAPVNPYSQRGRKRVAFFSTRLGAFVLLHSSALLEHSHRFAIRHMYGEPSRVTPETIEGYARGIAVPGTIQHALARVKCWAHDLKSLESDLPRIADVPTLFVWGSRDPAVPVSSAEPLKRHFRNSRLIVLDGVGHLPYEEVPEEFNKIVLDFLRS